MHKLLHAALAPLIVLASSRTASGLDLDNSGLLRTDTGLTYRAWLPKNFERQHGSVPLILFSHGFGGCAQQSETLTKAFAAAGYAVLAPNHRDEGCARYLGKLTGALSASQMRPDKPFTQPALWSDKTEANRRNDVEGLLQYALTHAPYRDAIDQSRIGAIGHSLGGYTVLGLGGAWRRWRDPRIKCVLALSPYAAPFVVKGTLAVLQIPVMYQTGTRDIGIAPVLMKQGGYAQTAGRKYLVVLRGAGHFAWTELNPDYQETIARYAIAFFDRELKGKTAAVLDEHGAAQVSQYVHEA